MAKAQNWQKTEQPTLGRPEAEIDANAVEMLAAADLNVSQIAMALGIDLTTLYRHFTKHPELRRRFEIGRENGNQMLLRKAWRVALDGDAGMLRFLIKNRVAGYADELNVKGKILHGHTALPPMTLDEVDARLAQLQPAVVKYLAEGTNGKTQAQPLEGEIVGNNTSADDERDGDHSRLGREDVKRVVIIEPARRGQQRKYMRKQTVRVKRSRAKNAR